jgi:hypothetical protein
LPKPIATARAIGVLFITASVAAVIGGSLLLPVTDGDLAKVAASEGQIVSGALIEMILALSVVGIAVLLFPVLKARAEGPALAYVGVRLLEAVLLMAASVSALVVFTLSQDSSAAGPQPLTDVALAAREWTYLVGSMVIFGVGALVLYALLYWARLVPAWLSVWGFLGGALIIGRGVAEMYGVELSPVAMGFMAAPIGLNEMVLAVWLIVKGFGAPAAKVPGEAAAPGSGSAGLVRRSR